MRPFKLKRHMSNSYSLNTLMAYSGGLQDAYTFLLCGKVFANTQTGNLAHIGMRLFSGDFKNILHYIIPVLSFAFGAFIAAELRHYKQKKLHWRQVSVLVEIILLTIVAIVPMNSELSIALVAITTGIQSLTFNKVGQFAYASTFFTGNIRNTASAFSAYLHSHDSSHLKRIHSMLIVTTAFILGAGSEILLCNILAKQSILVSVGMLVIAFFMMNSRL